jgi:aspartate aminotransferase
VRGIKPLLEAIQADSKRRRGGIGHELSEIIVSVGAKHTLFNIALCAYEPGDEVVIPAPYWVSYPDQVRLAGATPRIVETHEADGFRLTPEALRGAINPKTKAIILCSPSNPTGSAYTADQLAALAKVLREGDYWIVVDEIYGQLVYDGFVQKSLLEVAPDLKSRLVIVDGASKTYAMTGWRVGWALAPAALCAEMDKIQSQSTTNPTAVAQHATVAALNGPREPIEAMREVFAARRRAMVSGLDAIDGIRCRAPEGAFYAFPNVSELIGKRDADRKIQDDVQLAMWLLEAARVAVVPGTAFGAPGYLRLSYATSQELIEEGVRRIAQATAGLR